MVKKQENKVVTRAEKKDATKNVIKELLAVKPLKHNELIEETAKIYTQRFGGEETENVNDVKGRVGSVIDIMKKDGDVMYEGGMYALKARLPVPPTEEKTGTSKEKPVKKPRAKAKKEETPAPETKEEKPKKPTKKTKKTEVVAEKLTPSTVIESEITELKAEKPVEEKAVTPVKKAKTTKAKKEKAEPLPTAPLQPVAPVAPITPDVAPEPIPKKEKEEEKPKKTVKKTVKKAVKKPSKKQEKIDLEEQAKKTEKQADDVPVVEVKEEKTPIEPKAEPQGKSEQTEKKILENPPVVKEKGEITKKTEVIDMSFLFGSAPTKKSETKSVKTEEKAEKLPEKLVEKKELPSALKAEEKQEQPAAETPKKEEKPILKTVKTDEKRVKKVVQTIRKATKPQTADERLKEAFLRKLRSLGGDYFEYYSVYLLERYSMKNGRRLEGLRISGGDRDGGIDGEIELTDKLGFRETIYIQSKNWNPDKGDERLWVVGETLLQQFIGACACRQAQDRKQHCRGIFITTSRFTPDAKRILDAMSDKIVGYDGDDLYEAAKECHFGLVYENGNWKLDEKLLSGTKAFFNM